MKDVLLSGETTNIYIEGNRIASIGSSERADTVIDGRGKAAIPGLINTHTHAAMSLFRGYADDMQLQDWLGNKIWPLERNLKPEHIFWGTKLACLEMMKSGTTCFCDMYFHMEEAARAVQEMGIRAVLSEGFVDLMDPGVGKERIQSSISLVESIKSLNCSRLIPALGPHAIYTVSPESLKMIADLAERERLLVHFHLSETEDEVNSCVERNGLRPVEYLDRIGFLSNRLLAAHSVWLNNGEIALLARNGVKVSHNPVSNMKLAVGRAIPFREMKKAGLLISLGTDGCASNNSLDMFQTMKFAALYQKAYTGDPTVLPAGEVFALATENGASALGIDSGKIALGKLADIVLIDLSAPELHPGHNLTSDLVYAAGGSSVHTVICDGVVVMEDRAVKDEDQILLRANEAAQDLLGG